MTDIQLQELRDAGFPMQDHMRTGICLTEEEHRYCIQAIEIGNPNTGELKRRYAEVAAKHGWTQPLPGGYRYGSGSSLTLNVFYGEP